VVVELIVTFSVREAAFDMQVSFRPGAISSSSVAGRPTAKKPTKRVLHPTCRSRSWGFVSAGTNA
jgi:hypothetical protein